MSVDKTRRLGYGGSAVISNSGGGSPCQVLITSGSFDDTVSPSFLSMVDTPPSISGRTRVIHADGSNNYSGSLSFDVTAAAMALFTPTRLLGRWYPFDVGINDGNVSQNMVGCKVTSLSLSGAPGGLVTASVSFMASSAFSGGSVVNNFIRDDTTSSGQVVGYWWSGRNTIGLALKSWTLTMNQEANPVYGNTSGNDPLYIRVGMVDYLLDVETYDEFLGNSNIINICTSSFTLVGETMSRGFSFGGVTDLGTFRYSFGTAGPGSGGSNAVVIT